MNLFAFTAQLFVSAPCFIFRTASRSLLPGANTKWIVSPAGQFLSIWLTVTVYNPCNTGCGGSYTLSVVSGTIHFSDDARRHFKQTADN